MVRVGKRVLKDLDAIQAQNLPPIREAIHDLQQNPFPPGSKKLKGRKDLILRVRVGRYRIVYRVNTVEDHVVVLGISHRKEAYRLPW